MFTEELDTTKLLKKVGLWIGSVLAGCLTLGVIGIAILLLFLSQHETPGDDFTSFDCDKTLDIVKTLPSGGTFTINNSTATFRLGVAQPDRHCQRIFSDYATALNYCQQLGLNTIPSVQLIQGKFKQFDDSLCASLEMTMHNGLGERSLLGKQAALKRLLKLLQDQKGVTAEEVTVHVATALCLAGTEPKLRADLNNRVRSEQERFLANPMASRPIGFWDANEHLRAVFQVDRFLMQGFCIADSSAACVLLARTIVEDEELAHTFHRLQAFGDKLTNPSTTVPFETLAALNADEAARRFRHGERFALVSYAQSKEYSLLTKLLNERKFTDNESAMALIIEAIRSGRLSLEPTASSGWYDYQCHALETLLVPERARESAKLRLSAAYRKRLENAFATSLTKERETQIKRLPVLTLGLSNETTQKVAISPYFSAEPTPTVYLRYGRSYRFLHQALLSVLSKPILHDIHRPSATQNIDEELQEMVWFCYGLYERLCWEVGQQPQYLPNEMTAVDQERSAAVLAAWMKKWREDPILKIDTRVAVPISQWRGGPIRYWATGGVKLEPVIFTYDHKPIVKSSFEPIFVTGTNYLPTDIFLEFKRDKTTPITRTEFRTLCDRYKDELTLRKALGAELPITVSVWTKYSFFADHCG